MEENVKAVKPLTAQGIIQDNDNLIYNCLELGNNIYNSLTNDNCLKRENTEYTSLYVRKFNDAKFKFKITE